MEKERFDLKHELEKKEDKEKVLTEAEEMLEKERTMSLSIKEGSSTSVMSALTDNFVSPFALALNANNAQIGFLSSLTGLISPFAQIAGSKLMEKYSRKRIIVMFVALQALMWIPIALLSLFFLKQIWINYLPSILIIFYVLEALLGSIAGPPWFSLMGDLVPEKIRGKYFGKRNKIAGIVVLLTALAASFALDFFKTKGFLLLGFSILFAIATLFRLFSSNLFRKHYEPELKLKKDYYFTFIQFIKKSHKNNFGRFVIFVAVFYIGVSICSPFFSVYMLKNLGFSYTTFMIVNLSPSLFSLLFMPVWGKFSDKYGNRELLKIGAILVGAMPILWVFSPSPVYLILVPQLISGVGWAAFNLAASNFIYDTVSRERRAICVAYYNVLIGIGIFLGATSGGILAQYVHTNLIDIILLLFLLSGIWRLISIFIMKTIKEVRETEKPDYFKELSPTGDIAKGVFSGLADGVIYPFKLIKKSLPE